MSAVLPSNIMSAKRLIRRCLGDVTIDLICGVMYRGLRRLRGRRGPDASFTAFRRSDRQVFFGYYDVTPFSAADDLLLACLAPLPNESPRRDATLDVGYFELSDADQRFHTIDTTPLWCWQQGCRLQWHPGENTEAVLYNTVVDDSPVCITRDIRTREVLNCWPRPAYAISPDGRWAATLDFARLQRLRPGYGYGHFPEPDAREPAPADDGLWLIDTEAGTTELLASLAHLATMFSNAGEPMCYLNHICFNPSGNRMLFFYIREYGTHRVNRLMGLDIDGDRIPYILDSETHVSHYAWHTDSEILLVGRSPSRGSLYYLLDVDTREQRPLDRGTLPLDGHPSFLPGDRFVLTDTVPNKYSERDLLVYDREAGTTRTIASVRSPVRLRGELRCDLHPRLSRSGRLACVDIAEGHKRAMALFETEIVPG